MDGSLGLVKATATDLWWPRLTVPRIGWPLEGKLPQYARRTEDSVAATKMRTRSQECCAWREYTLAATAASRGGGRHRVARKLEALDGLGQEVEAIVGLERCDHVRRLHGGARVFGADCPRASCDGAHQQLARALEAERCVRADLLGVLGKIRPDDLRQPGVNRILASLGGPVDRLPVRARQNEKIRLSGLHKTKKIGYPDERTNGYFLKFLRFLNFLSLNPTDC